jgi:tetratricopeptide (TPR) repeat protein
VGGGLAQVDELRARAPRTRVLPELSDEVDRGRVEAKRLAEVEEYLSEARRRKAAEDFRGALSRVDAALAVCPDHEDASVLRQEIEEFVASTERRREAEASASRKAEQEAATAWLSEADHALRAGRFDAALKALEEVNEAVVTATQAVRLRDLAADAESRREKARAEKAALRQQQIVEVRARVGGLLGRGRSAAQAAVRDRRIQIGGAAMVVLAVVAWAVIPSSAPTDEGGPAASGANPSNLSGAVDGLVEPSDAGASDAAPAEEATAVPDPLDDALTALTDLADAGRYREAFESLQMLDGRNPRVERARGALELDWNAAGVESADRARAQSDAGDFGAALTLIDRFEPENEFVESAREEVEREWAADAETLSRRALEMAAAGDHDGAVALLEASTPPHPSVTAALSELVDNPECTQELPSVRAALVGLTLSPGVASPSFAACEGAYRLEIQSEVVRFGAGCERASASAFVPLLCEGSAEWTSPRVVGFVLQKTEDSWSIAEVAEMAAEAAPR